MVGSIAIALIALYGTVIAAGFVDRQELHELEADARRPINELAQPFEVTDAEIRFRAQGKEGCEHARDTVLRRKIHDGNDEARMTKSETIAK